MSDFSKMIRYTDPTDVNRVVEKEILCFESHTSKRKLRIGEHVTSDLQIWIKEIDENPDGYTSIVGFALNEREADALLEYLAKRRKQRKNQ